METLNRKLINTALIWDHYDPPPSDQNVFLWNGYKEKRGQRSLLKAIVLLQMELEKHMRIKC